MFGVCYYRQRGLCLRELGLFVVTAQDVFDLALGAAADDDIVELAVSTANSTSKAIQSCLTMPEQGIRCILSSGVYASC